MDETQPVPKKRGRPKGSFGPKRKAVEEAKRLALEPVAEEDSPEAERPEEPEVPEEPEEIQEPEVPQVPEEEVPQSSEDEPVVKPKSKPRPKRKAEAAAPKPKRARKAPVRANEVVPDERTYLDRWKAQERERLRAERAARISRYDAFFMR